MPLYGARVPNPHAGIWELGFKPGRDKAKSSDSAISLELRFAPTEAGIFSAGQREEISRLVRW